MSDFIEEMYEEGFSDPDDYMAYLEKNALNDCDPFFQDPERDQDSIDEF